MYVALIHTQFEVDQTGRKKPGKHIQCNPSEVIMTLKFNQGHQNWQESVKVDGSYYQVKFESSHLQFLRKVNFFVAESENMSITSLKYMQTRQKAVSM